MMTRAFLTAAAVFLVLAAHPRFGPDAVRAAPDRPLMKSVSDETDQDPGPGNGEELKNELRKLMDELKGLEKDVREKIEKDIIPLIREEIQRFREKLKEFEPEEEPPDTRTI
jgi:hypothetical protein